MDRQLSVLVHALPPENLSAWNGEASRKLIAGRFGELGVADCSDFFHYNDNGTPKGEYPLIRFLGGNKSFRVVGIGTNGSQLLGQFLSYFPDLFKTAKQVRIERGEISAVESEYFKYYTAYSVGVPIQKTKNPELLSKIESKSNEAKEWLEKWMERQIERQMNALQMHSAPRPRVRIKDYTVLTPLVVKRETSNYSYTRLQINFYSTVNLKGNWAIGRLTSRGHGQIKQVRKYLQKQSEEARV